METGSLNQQINSTKGFPKPKFRSARLTLASGRGLRYASKRFSDTSRTQPRTKYAVAINAQISIPAKQISRFERFCVEIPDAISLGCKMESMPFAHCSPAIQKPIAAHSVDQPQNANALRRAARECPIVVKLARGGQDSITFTFDH